MNPPSVKATWIEFLPESLWENAPFGERSDELTCLYVEQYAGRHNSRSFTVHDWWEFLCITRGRGEFLCPAGRLPLEVGTVCLIPPGTEHLETSPSRMDTIWVGVTGTMLKTFPANGVRKIASGELPVLFETILSQTIPPRTATGPEFDGLARMLLGGFWREFVSSRQSTLEDDMDDAAEFLRHHFARTVSMPELADTCGYSEGHFYRSFKKRFGASPRRFLEDIRMEQAVKLMHFSDARVEEIARQVGYDDPLYFSRAFRKRYLQSPSEYRRSLV
ncbi:MAG: helix-turn-helix transcriptional regulator [Phycisphaerae bacterium]|nr:helix-turn-helix transcriptional regulator [Phycisphaerae bacterium]